MITVLIILPHVSVVVNIMWGKPMMNSDLNGTISKAMIRKMHGMKHVCKNICLSILKVKVSGFLGNVSITLTDKTDGKDPKRRENYWMRTLKTYAPFGLNIEDSV